jgi:hypothetical protein
MRCTHLYCPLASSSFFILSLPQDGQVVSIILLLIFWFAICSIQLQSISPGSIGFLFFIYQLNLYLELFRY